MKDKSKLLVEILLDKNASLTERDDAAIYLSDFSDDNVVNALIQTGSDKNENEIVLNSAGETLGLIWTKNNSFNESAFYSLTGIARSGVYFTLENKKSEWIEKYKLNNPSLYK